MSNRYFRATYLTPEARKVRRVFFVPTMQDVRRELGVDGNVVQSITEHESNFFTREYYPRGYTLNFLKSLAFHIEVGTSAGQGVAHFIESERNAAKRAEMQPALERLTHGDSFGHAVAALPFLDRSTIALLQAADMAGTLNEGIGDALAIQQERKTTWKTLGVAMSWIAFDLFSVVSTVVSLQFYALPWFQKNVPQFRNPELTAQYIERVQRISTVNLALTVVTIGLVVAMAVLIGLFFFGNRPTRDWLQQRIVRLPILRNIFIDGALSDGLLLLSRMGKGGMPLMQCLEVLSAYSWIGVVSVFWRKLQQSLNAGWDVKTAFESGELLTEQELRSLAAHQNREHLAKVLAAIAMQRRDESEAGMRRFIRWSILILVLYMLVGVGMGVWLFSIQDFGLSSSMEELMR